MSVQNLRGRERKACRQQAHYSSALRSSLIKPAWCPSSALKLPWRASRSVSDHINVDGLLNFHAHGVAFIFVCMPCGLGASSTHLTSQSSKFHLLVPGLAGLTGRPVRTGFRCTSSLMADAFILVGHTLKEDVEEILHANPC